MFQPQIYSEKHKEKGATLLQNINTHFYKKLFAANPNPNPKGLQKARGLLAGSTACETALFYCVLAGFLTVLADINMFYWAALYKDLDQKKIAEDVRKEGFNPIYISDPPAFFYSSHRHPETKLLVFLKGSMEVRVQGEIYQCRVGDKLIIPGDFEHSALSGPEGCSFFWSEKL